MAADWLELLSKKKSNALGLTHTNPNQVTSRHTFTALRIMCFHTNPRKSRLRCRTLAYVLPYKSVLGSHSCSHTNLGLASSHDLESRDSRGIQNWLFRFSGSIPDPSPACNPYNSHAMLKLDKIAYIGIP